MRITYALIYFVRLSEFGDSKGTGTDFTIWDWFHLLSAIIIIEIDRNKALHFPLNIVNWNKNGKPWFTIQFLAYNQISSLLIRNSFIKLNKL